MLIRSVLDSEDKLDGLIVLIMPKCYVEVTNFSKNKLSGNFLRFDITTTETTKETYGAEIPEFLLLLGDMGHKNLNSSCLPLDQIFYSTLLKEKVKEELSQDASEKFIDWSKHNPFGESENKGSTRIFKQKSVNNVFQCGEFDQTTDKCDGRVVAIHSKFVEFSNMIQGKYHGRTVRINKDGTSHIMQYEDDVKSLVHDYDDSNLYELAHTMIANARGHEFFDRKLSQKEKF